MNFNAYQLSENLSENERKSERNGQPSENLHSNGRLVVGDWERRHMGSTRVQDGREYRCAPADTSLVAAHIHFRFNPASPCLS